MPRRSRSQVPLKLAHLTIRLAPDDLVRVKAAAEANHLDASTWARQVILLAVMRQWEKAQKMGPSKSGRD